MTSTTPPVLQLADPAREVALLRPAIDEAVGRVLTSGRFILGPEVEAFEAEAARTLRVPHAVGVSNGTDAIVLALQALGVGSGDEVITSAFSFFATAGAIARTGATPVFADVEPGTFNLDPSRVEAAIGPKTRAIVPVHLFGRVADMTRLGEIAKHRGLALVEDAAQAFGAEHRGARVHPASAAATYSFFPAKVLGACGDAGLVATHDADLAARLKRLREHGARAKNVHEEIGGNFRIHPMQAAILRVKLPHLDAWIAKRQANAAHLCALLGGDTARVRLPKGDPDGRHVWAQLTVRCPDRDALAKHLGAAGIGSAIYYPLPLPEQPALQRFTRPGATFPETTRACREVLSIPVHPHLPDGSMDRIAAAIRAFGG
jgi:dTDP-4-amino-4,6-dideoxygalactose transaminase